MYVVLETECSVSYMLDKCSTNERQLQTWLGLLLLNKPSMENAATYRNVWTAQIKKGKSFQEVQRKQNLGYNVTWGNKNQVKSRPLAITTHKLWMRDQGTKQHRSAEAETAPVKQHLASHGSICSFFCWSCVAHNPGQTLLGFQLQCSIVEFRVCLILEYLHWLYQLNFTNPHAPNPSLLNYNVNTSTFWISDL